MVYVKKDLIADNKFIMNKCHDTTGKKMVTVQRMGTDGLTLLVYSRVLCLVLRASLRPGNLEK